jgi:hypothetical protein
VLRWATKAARASEPNEPSMAETAREGECGVRTDVAPAPRKRRRMRRRRVHAAAAVPPSSTFCTQPLTQPSQGADGDAEQLEEGQAGEHGSFIEHAVSDQTAFRRPPKWRRERTRKLAAAAAEKAAAEAIAASGRKRRAEDTVRTPDEVARAAKLLRHAPDDTAEAAKGEATGTPPVHAGNGGKRFGGGRRGRWPRALGAIAAVQPAAVELPRRRVLYCASFRSKPGLHK